MGLIGLLIVVVVAVLVAVWLSPLIPEPGGAIVRVCAWIVVVIAVIYFLVGLVSGTASYGFVGD